MVLIVALLHRAPISEASHTYPSSDNPKRHAATSHDTSPGIGINDENFCTEVKDGTTQQSDVTTAVRSALSGGWDLFGNARLDYYGALVACNALSNNDLQNTKIKAYVYQNTDPYCPGTSTTVNCVVRGVSIYDDRFEHNHYRDQYVYLNQNMFTTYTAATREQILNHEFGHTVGLKDPETAAEGCANDYVPSIMHISYYLDDQGCPEKAYTGTEPAAKDKQSVLTVMQDMNFLPQARTP
jgi:hypothetical protein